MASSPIPQSNQQIIKVKRQLQESFKKQQIPLSQKLKDTLQKINSKGQFPCRFVGLHFIHNYLMFVRERIIPEKNELLIFDLRDKQQINEFRILKSQQIQPDQVVHNQETLSLFKQQIHFKYIFMIGESKDFDSASFTELMNQIIDLEMKPFCFYLHRLKQELVEAEFPHLIIRGHEKRKLGYYPQIIVKCKDMGLEKSKNKFQILMANSQIIRAQQVLEMQITKAIQIDDESSFSPGKKQEGLQGIEIVKTQTELNQLKEVGSNNHSSRDEYKKAFLNLAKKVSLNIQKSLQSDSRILILSSDCDNLVAATIIYFLLDQHKFTFDKAYSLLKERRISVNIVDIICDILKEFSQEKNNGSQAIQMVKINANIKRNDEKSFKEKLIDQMKLLHVEQKKILAKTTESLDLLTRLIKNVIENPNEDKFRQFKMNNAKIQEKLTQFKSGNDLIKMLGFQEILEQSTNEPIYYMSNNLSMSFIKGRRLDFEAAVSEFRIAALKQ